MKWHATSMVALLSQADDLVQVYLMMQHAQANYDMKFFMKADDDTYINIPVMLNALRESVKDRFVYIGYRVRKTSRYAFLFTK